MKMIGLISLKLSKTVSEENCYTPLITLTGIWLVIVMLSNFLTA